MKKTILTTVAVAALTSSAFAAQTGQTYLKGGLGYDTSKFNGEKKVTGALAGVISAGYMLNDMLGVEGFVDYKVPNIKRKNETENTSSKFTARDIGLGGKIFIQQVLADKLSLNTGVGAGVAFKAAEYNYSKKVTNNNDTTKGSAQLGSKNIVQPFGSAGVGADYTISDGVAVGIEYTVKFCGKRDYKAREGIDSVKATAAGINQVTKGDTFAKTNNFSQAITANVKFAL